MVSGFYSIKKLYNSAPLYFSITHLLNVIKKNGAPNQGRLRYVPVKPQLNIAYTYYVMTYQYTLYLSLKLYFRAGLTNHFF